MPTVRSVLPFLLIVGCATARSPLLDPVQPRFLSSDTAGLTILESHRAERARDRATDCLGWPQRSDRRAAIAMSDGEYREVCATFAGGSTTSCPPASFADSVVLAFVPAQPECRRFVGFDILSDGRVTPAFETRQKEIGECERVCESCSILAVVPIELLPRTFTLFVRGVEARPATPLPPGDETPIVSRPRGASGSDGCRELENLLATYVPAARGTMDKTSIQKELASLHESRANCLAGLSRSGIAGSQALISRYLDQRGLLPANDRDDFVNPVILDALDSAPGLTANLPPLIARARSVRAIGTPWLLRRACTSPLPITSQLAADCAAIDDVADQRLRHRRIVELGIVGAVTAVAAGDVALASLRRNEPLGRGLATGSAAAGGTVLGGFLGATVPPLAAHRPLSRSSCCATKAVGAILGGIGGALAGFIATRAEGPARPWTAAAGMLPIVAYASAHAAFMWNQE